MYVHVFKGDDKDNSGNDDDSSTCEKKVTDAVTNKEKTSNKKISSEKMSCKKRRLNQEKELKMPMNKKKRNAMLKNFWKLSLRNLRTHQQVNLKGRTKFRYAYMCKTSKLSKRK
ncbi:Hypothetical predicted protein [Paramuricea clavata]|uniref:Uncharacterized protein n=1 Tax=Paramuricea clavata TaxID=317549 RepID=A0A7D9DY85_PARCT|nr:Hypothetical predicted protein [Paramuricea clavata]